MIPTVSDEGLAALALDIGLLCGFLNTTSCLGVIDLELDEQDADRLNGPRDSEQLDCFETQSVSPGDCPDFEVFLLSSPNPESSGSFSCWPVEEFCVAEE